MKTVDSNFTDERDKQHPVRAKHRVTLQAYTMSGSAITDERYDLTDSLINLPEIKSELEDQMNANKASSITLNFYDNDDTIWDYFGSGSRRWAIKIEQTYDTPNITVADNISCGDNPIVCDFSPNGKYLFVGHYGTNNTLYKFEVGVGGGLTLSTSVNTTEKFYRLKVTNDYLYATKASGVFEIFDYDLTLQDSTTCGSKDLFYLTISSDENYAWVVANPSDSDDKVYLVNMTDKTNISDTIEITGFTPSTLETIDDYLYVGDYDDSSIKTYDISTPTSPSLQDTLTLDISIIRDSYLDDDKNIIYYVGGNGTTIRNIAIVDIADRDDPILTTTSDSHYGFTEKKNKYLFLSNPGYPTGKTTMYVMDTLNHYKIEEYNSTELTGTYNSLSYNQDNVLAILDGTNDKVYTYTIWQNWVTLFEGIIDYQSLNKIGRNKTSFTSYTGEKELEVYNAEQVYDATSTNYLRNITGVTVAGITGGTTGAKKLEYTYKTLNEGGSNIDEFGLKYEGGEEYLFRVAGNYFLTGSSGQIIVLTVSDTDALPRKDAQDTMVVGDTENHTTIGYWYESQDIATVVGLLWDESDFTISTQNTDIDTDITVAADTWQFDYKEIFDIDAGDYHSCIEDNPPDSDTIIVARGTKVYKMAYDATTRVFTETELLTITDTFADAEWVSKILRMPNGNTLVVCVSGTKEAGFNGWCDLEGIMEIENDGTIDDTWDENFLKNLGGVNTASKIAGSSVELINYTKSTGETENRNGFYWLQYRLTLSPDTRYFYVSFVDIDDDPTSIANTTQIYTALAAAGCWVAPNIVYHRYWVGTPTGGDYHCWFIMANNLGGYIERVETGGAGDVEESLTYCTETTINSIRAIRADSSQNRFYLITSKMASEKQYAFKCIASGSGSTSINTDTLDSLIDYPVYLPDIERAVVFELDSSEYAQNLAMLNWGSGTDNPTLTNLVTGFLGSTYSPHPVCYLDDDETYAGCAEMGALAITRFFIGSNLSAFIVPVADFTDLNVRQALDMLAEAYVCLWNRPELNTANFISRGNYTDSYTVEKGLYLPQYYTYKQPIYLAVEAKNTYYEGRTYLARYPDNYMGNKGDMLQIDNRFITSINKNAVAKVYYDFYNTIRRIFEIEAYYLIELELFDKIVMTLYDIDGDSSETVNTVLVEKSFNNANKTVKLKLIELGASAFSSTTGFMMVGGIA
jgi:hypothetical protein